MTRFTITACFIGIAAGLFSVAPAHAKFRPPAQSKTHSFGNAEQKVTPKYVRETLRSDGSKSYVYGQHIDKNGKVIGDHGHSVVGADGKLKYARTPGGVILKDDKK